MTTIPREEKDMTRKRTGLETADKKGRLIEEKEGGTAAVSFGTMRDRGKDQGQSVAAMRHPEHMQKIHSFFPGGSLVFSSFGLCRNNFPFGLRAAPGRISGIEQARNNGGELTRLYMPMNHRGKSDIENKRESR